MSTSAVERKKYDLDRTVRLIITVVAVCLAVYVVNYFSGILLPFLVGCLLAYMLEPIVLFFKKLLHVKSRMIPAILTMLLFFGAIYLICRYLIPYFIAEFAEMGKLLTKYVANAINSETMPGWLANFLDDYLNVKSIQQIFSQEQWMKIADGLMTGTVSVLGTTMKLVATITSWLLALLYMFFVLIDYDIIARSFKAAVPQQYRRAVFRVFNDVTDSMSRYFRGQALVSLFVGIIFAIEFAIIGLPMPIAFGLSIGVLNMVPYLQLISIPFAAFLCLVQSVATGCPFWPLAGWTFAAYCICQVIQDVVLTPLIMKSQMGLRPAIIFLALALWSYLLGFVGLIIALPLTSLIIAYYNEFVLKVPKHAVLLSRKHIHEKRKADKEAKKQEAEVES